MENILDVCGLKPLYYSLHYLSYSHRVSGLPASVFAGLVLMCTALMLAGGMAPVLLTRGPATPTLTAFSRTIRGTKSLAGFLFARSSGMEETEMRRGLVCV